MSEPARTPRWTLLRHLHALALRNRILRSILIRPRLLAAWNGGVLLYIALTGAMMAHDDLDRMRERTNVQDEGRFVILVFSIIAAVASIAAIVVQLAETKDLVGEDKAVHIAHSIMTILTGWTFIHLTFALHYAHEYANERRNRPHVAENLRGGLNFPDTLTPDYSDFLYFSFTIGVASQTADVTVCSPKMRRIVLLHGVLSFFYNTTIVALTINIAAGLI